MKSNYIFTVFFSLIFFSSVNAQSMSEAGSLGLGFASSYPGYGLSAKYNFTETHAAQLIVGGASYGFGTSSFALSGRYLYNFEEGGSGFNYKPFVYGQLGYYSVEFDFGVLGGSESFNTISFGVGGGVEFSFDNFIDGLAFSGELGYVGGSFDDDIGTYAGLSYGAGIHYYFNL